MNAGNVDSSNAPRRLVFGPATYAGYEGVIVDAEAAERFGRAAGSRTYGEFAVQFQCMNWNDYVAAEFEDAADAPSPADAFDYNEWFTDANVYPSDTAWDVAANRVSQLVSEHPVELGDIRAGGGSPGGNTDAITGPLAQLALLSKLIDPVRDGFTLERDDSLVDLGMSRSLYAEDDQQSEDD